jgi:branched-chain amino acid transport system permease protein
LLNIRIRHLVATLLAVFALAAAVWSPAHASDPVTVKVRVQDQTEVNGKAKKAPVPGVTVNLLDASGAQIATGVTDDKGVIEFPLPDRADYTVVLVESTLPEGKGLSAQTPAERSIHGDDFRTPTVTINYFTGEAQRTTKSFMGRLAQRMVDGARLGLIIAMSSVGLSLIFGTTGLTNFAHGEMVTLGGMMAYLVNVTMGISFWIAGPVAVLAGGAFGYLLDLGLFAPLRRRGIGLVSQLVVSVGLSIMLRNFFLYKFGGRTLRLAAFNDQKNLTFGPVGITPRDLSTAIISLIVLVFVALALQRTRMGKATRAVSDNPDLAASTGIDSQKIIRIVWILGGLLAAMGGVFRALDEGVSPDLGADLLFLMFAGITLGGLGSAFGALVGGFIVGLFVEVSTMFGVPSELKKVPALLVLVFILLVRPQGILGRRERVG